MNRMNGAGKLARLARYWVAVTASFGILAGTAAPIAANADSGLAIAPLRRAAAAPVQRAPAPAIAPSRAAGSLGPLINVPQTWNNCGPVSVVEVLAYWGVRQTQYQAQAILRADNSPGGMGPYGVPGYVRSFGLRALLGVDGSQRLLKALISNGFPVIVNQWYSVYDHTRHYRPIEAYDDAKGLFVASDPWGGPNFAISYANFASVWSVSHNRFMVVYPLSRAALLNAVLASAGWNPAREYSIDLARQQARLKAERGSAMGSIGHMYGYLGIAWDQLQLGRKDAARAALAEASRHGASPIVIGWIEREIAR